MIHVRIPLPNQGFALDEDSQMNEKEQKSTKSSSWMINHQKRSQLYQTLEQINFFFFLGGFCLRKLESIIIKEICLG